MRSRCTSTASRFCDGKGNEAFSAGVPLAAGDVITVKATKRGGPARILLCDQVFQRASDHHQRRLESAIGPTEFGAQWGSAETDSDQCLRPGGTGKRDWPVPSCQNRLLACEAAEIWAASWENTCYLFYVVGRSWPIPGRKLAK